MSETHWELGRAWEPAPAGRGVSCGCCHAGFTGAPCGMCSSPRRAECLVRDRLSRLQWKRLCRWGRDQAASGSSVFVGGGGGCHSALSSRLLYPLSPEARCWGWTAPGTWLCPLPPKAPFPRGGGLPSAWWAQEGGKSCHPPPPPTSLCPERGVRTGDVSRAAGEDTCLCCSPFHPSPGKWSR